MATTTNYGWTTPDDTALVKDGAAAIRTLGSSVDTTTKALNPSTTLGDIEYRSSTANTNTRLGIGTTGQALLVSGGVPAWGTISAGGMTLINTGGTTLTGASVTISSIPSTYNDLLVIIRNARTVDDGGDPTVRINGDSTASRHARLLSSNATGVSFNNTLWSLINQQDNGASESLISLLIPDYANTTSWKIGRSFGVANDPTTSTNISYLQGMFAYNQTGAISSLQFIGDANGWTSGTVFVYGVK
jgi:hypothetical protein